MNNDASNEIEDDSSPGSPFKSMHRLSSYLLTSFGCGLKSCMVKFYILQISTASVNNNFVN